MEQVLLLDEAGNCIGREDKAGVHHTDTPLHLAFSSYVFDSQRRLLITQRAEHKRTWPGVWTNSCCGHPLPGEVFTDSVLRRLRDELGLVRVEQVELILPRFRYRAVMDNGVVENEMCPVFRAVIDDAPEPNAEEVAATRWVPWSDFSAQVLDGRVAISPWCLQQVDQLVRLGPDPLAWPSATPDELPPAARQTE